MFLFYGGKEAKEDSKTVSCLALESFELCTRYMAESGKLDLLAKYLDTAVVAEKDDDNILEEDDDDGSDAFKIHANIIKLEVYFFLHSWCSQFFFVQFFLLT